MEFLLESQIKIKGLGWGFLFLFWGVCVANIVIN